MTIYPWHNLYIYPSCIYPTTYIQATYRHNTKKWKDCITEQTTHINTEVQPQLEGYNRPPLGPVKETQHKPRGGTTKDYYTHIYVHTLINTQGDTT